MFRKKPSRLADAWWHFKAWYEGANYYLLAVTSGLCALFLLLWLLQRAPFEELDADFAFFFYIDQFIRKGQQDANYLRVQASLYAAMLPFYGINLASTEQNFFRRWVFHGFVLFMPCWLLFVGLMSSLGSLQM